MTTVLLAGFALLWAAFFLGLYQLWRAHRRSVMREKEIAIKMMTRVRRQSNDGADG